jgi:N-acetylglucosamine kinase-like BadF-type ATPase
MPEPCIRLGTDIEIAYLDSFKPGTGYLVYAGTGSIAAYIDEAGQFHRAGGRGYLLTMAAAASGSPRSSTPYLACRR